MRLIGPLLRRFGIDPSIGQYVAVGLRPGEVDVRVTLERRGTVEDISACCSVASLRPLRLLIASPRDTCLGPAQLFFSQSGESPIGRLGIDPVGRCGPQGSYGVYKVVRHQNACVGIVELGINYLRYEIARVGRVREKDQFLTSGSNLWSLLVFYTRPRPVVIVSVADDGPANLFPMDLLGSTNEGAFLMALRTTSPNVAVMSRTRRIAMCEVPPAFKSHAYTLGSGHKRLREVGEELPFDVSDSPVWRLPLPTAAVRVREVEVTHVDEVGSHHLFTTRVVHDAESPELRLHHISGFYERSLRRRQRAIVTA